jgi:hypothetical protein
MEVHDVGVGAGDCPLCCEERGGGAQWLQRNADGPDRTRTRVQKALLDG